MWRVCVACLCGSLSVCFVGGVAYHQNLLRCFRFVSFRLLFRVVTLAVLPNLHRLLPPLCVSCLFLSFSLFLWEFIKWSMLLQDFHRGWDVGALRLRVRHQPLDRGQELPLLFVVHNVRNLQNSSTHMGRTVRATQQQSSTATAWRWYVPWKWRFSLVQNARGYPPWSTPSARRHCQSPYACIRRWP